MLSRRRRLVRALWALGSLAWLAMGPALSQTVQQRVPIVLSQLPPHSSASYKRLRQHAGDATVEALSLTKSEVWSVPPARVNALKQAAARYGIGIRELAADWNHVFQSKPAHAMSGDEHKAMMAQAKSSSAAIGVGMMLPLRAAMVEYALTKGANTPSPAGGEPARIVLQLNDATTLDLVRTSVAVKSNMLIWRGAVDGAGGPATIMWWPGVTMTGTVRHEGRIYSIRRVRGGEHAIAVVEMKEDRMPPEHAPMPPRLRNDPSLRDDPLVRNGDASTLRSFLRSLQPPRVKRPETEGDARPGGNAEQPSKPGGSTAIVINVMVAYTKKAAQEYADIRRELVELAVEEANQSFRNSNLGHIRLQLVHAYQTDYVEEGEHFDHLWRFADRDDGYMDEVHGLREKYDADVAILVVNDAKGCGLATRVFADAEEAFAVVHHECAATSFSVAHEIGHLIGARHELGIDRLMTPFPYGHGYVNGTKWRDIMSYKESCGGCRRVPIWSSPRVIVEGEPAGTAREDNARVIAEQAGRIAGFRPSRSRQVYSRGPTPATPGIGAADQAATPK